MRFKLELLHADVSQMSDQLARMANIDRRLKARFAPGPFMWETELAPGAPADVYWFLYGRPA